MENYQFPSTYTAISGLLDDVDNSKQWNFELWHYCIKATICSNDKRVKKMRVILGAKEMRVILYDKEKVVMLNVDKTLYLFSYIPAKSLFYLP